MSAISLEKYQAGGRNRYPCPQCGKSKVFTRYVQDGQYLADHVGKCNRASNCGYHYAPKQFFEDNPSLDTEEYEGKLEGLGSPDLVKAMRYGLWDITAGAALEKLSRDKHMLRPFTPPQHWTKFTCIDWGTAKPFSVGWYCVCDDDMELTAKGAWPVRFVPRGALIRYREYYGWNGKPNEGCRMESFEVAQKIIDIEDEVGEIMDYRIGDSSMWSQHDGPTVAERMFSGTNGRYNMSQSNKDRIANYQEIRARIAGEDDVPMFYATADCKHFWRTVPDLQLDEDHPEKGPDTDQEEHVYDELSYACASRPMIITKRERVDLEYRVARKRAGHRKRKGY